MYCIFDIETTIKTSFKRKANPFDPDNWVVLAGWLRKGGDKFSHYYGKARPGAGWLGEVLEGTKILVGHNIKFDILHAISNDPENLRLWMRYIARGGMLWDTQVGEYMLDGLITQSHYLSLEEVCVRYGGNVKLDEVKRLWAAGVSTEHIDQAILTDYLMGGEDEHGVYQKGDLENTEVAFLGQIAKARSLGMMNSLLLNMESLVASVEMERNGMFVDSALGLQLADELSEEIAGLEKELAKYIPADLPFDFSWTSRQHKSALIFGGIINYDCREYDKIDGTTTWDAPDQLGSIGYAYAMQDELHALLSDGSTCPFDKWEEVCGKSELTPVVFASGKNKGEIKTRKVKIPNYDKPRSRIKKRPYAFKGYTAPDEAWRSADGFYSVSSEIIEELGSRNVPFLKALARYQSASKDLGTYYISHEYDDAGNVIPDKSAGMLTLVQPDGIIHHSINHTATVTGRFSSSSPNLQNVAKGNKSKVKTVFRSRFAGGKIVQSDFSALEVYVQAILTKCKQLISDLQAGLDMHCARLSSKTGKPYDEVLKLAKGYKLPDGTFVPPEKEWDYARTAAKVFSFQRAYGAGNAKIADSAGMTIEEVEALVEADNKRYPEIEPFYETFTAQVKAARLPWRTVPHPTVRGVMCNLGISRIQTPDGKLYTFTEEPSPEYLVKRGTAASFSPTVLKNYTTQGSGGEWMKAAMSLLVRAFYARENFGGKAVLVNTVHDAAYVDAHPDVALEAAALVHACMSAASEYMEYKFKWEVPVPVPSDTSWGDSMADEDAIPTVKEAAAPLRLALRNEYMNGYLPSFERTTQ